MPRVFRNMLAFDLDSNNRIIIKRIEHLTPNYPPSTRCRSGTRLRTRKRGVSFKAFDVVTMPFTDRDASGTAVRIGDFQ